MDEQCFHGIAHAGTLALGIDRDFFGHGQIGCFVDIDVANAVVVFDHRHARVFHHGLDEGVTAARHDDVEVTIHLGEQSDAVAVGERHELDHVGGQPCVDGPD